MISKKSNTPSNESQSDEVIIINPEVDESTNPDIETHSDLDAIMADDTPVKKVKKKKTKEFYVDEKEFDSELREYYQTNVISVKLADMIRKMINGLAHRPNFINYTFRDEATGDALVNIMAALHKKKFRFAENKKPFSYFNAIAWNCWRNRIKREARQRNALAAYQDEIWNDVIPPTGHERED